MEDKEERNMVPFPFPSPSSETVTQVKGFQSFQSTNATVTNADGSDSFYMKLTELLDSSGLGLIVNVRETLLDLYLFYLEVTKRGGYHQVARGKKWGEVVSALKLEGCNAKLSGQVERLYARFLYQYERLYFYRSPSKHSAAASSNKGSLKGKWKSRASLSQLKNIQDGQMVTKMCPYPSCQTTGDEFVGEQVVLPAPSIGEEKKKRRGAPRGRNGYQIFLKNECARLKTSGEVSDGTNILRVATDAWNKMSETEKQPYVEESKKIKEKSKEAMISDTKQKNTMEWKGPSVSGDYYIPLLPETDN
ncbi:PREDICTED: high mobility group B protein 10-like isoform X2 [Lupinus angustifolius]|uniref:high mobility group B protein 10-like isoform X2 n=1 Tax=Lupinus angustifolius TaxID=3871 RepID=UPI00092F8A14|nr:PREDICTED: high mobility group B protein 10-like isoform X2 [Lupinus angustifolius]